MARTIEIAANAAASAWTDLTSSVRWEGMRFGGEADSLGVGTGSGFNLDDDSATVVLPTRRVFRITEDATASPTILFKGRIADKTVQRSQRFEGDARAFDTTLDDNNAQLRGIPVDGWVRPAETGRARVLAVIAAFANGSPRASTVIDTSTYCPNTNTIVMPAHTYDETDVAEVILDCAQTEGKVPFVTQTDKLFYDKDTSTAYAATCSITDTGANETTSFSPYFGVAGTQAGNEFFSGGTLKYGPTPSVVSDVRSAAETAHDYWRTVLTDGSADATAAAAILGTMLDNQSIEELSISVEIKVPAASVDRLAYGQTISFRASAAGVTSAITLRIASLYWEPVGNSLYVAHLTLGVPKKWRRRVVKHTNPANTSGTGPNGGGAGPGGGAPCGCAPYVNYQCATCSTPANAGDNDAQTMTGTTWHTNFPAGFDRLSSVANGGSAPTGTAYGESTSGPQFVRRATGYAGAIIATIYAQLHAPPFPGNPYTIEDHEEREYVSFAIPSPGFTPAAVTFDGTVYLDTSWTGSGQTAARAILPATAWELVSVFYDTTALTVEDNGGAHALDLLNYPQQIVASGLHPGGNVGQSIHATAAFVPGSATYVAFFLRNLADNVVHYFTDLTVGTSGRYPLYPAKVTGAGPTGGQSLTIPTYTVTWCECPVTQQFPGGNQSVENEVSTAIGDGTTTTFYTTRPYQPASISVYIQGINVTTSVVSFGPPSGLVTFTQAPKSGAEITFRYVAA